MTQYADNKHKGPMLPLFFRLILCDNDIDVLLILLRDKDNGFCKDRKGGGWFISTRSTDYKGW